MSKPLFSVVLVHYSQPGYVKEALDSIFLQNYENIELVFADDGSQDIDLDDLKDYVYKHKGENIKNVVWQINETNLGTTKNLNRAIKSCSGKYLLFFAADDKLYDENVLTNFVKSFEKCPEDIAMISAQADMMDDKLEKSLGLFVKPNFARDFNSLEPLEQFKVFSKTCFLAIGASCMRLDMFKKYGYFNEEYKLVEDWSYFLHLTRNGGKIKYFDFKALCHRDGGTSHYDNAELVPQNVLDYKYDIIQIFEKEVFPYTESFSYPEKIKLVEKYDWEKADYASKNGKKPCMSKQKIFSLMPTVFVKRFILTKLAWAPGKMNYYLDRMAKAALIWVTLLLFDFFLLINLQIPQDVRLLVNSLNLYVFPAIEIVFALMAAPYLLLYWLFKIRAILRNLKCG